MGNSCSPSCIPAIPASRRGVDDIRRYYKIGRIIGCGSFGQVRECVDRETGQVYAVKVMERRMSGKEKMTPGRPSNEAMIRSEVDILKSLNHENIVAFVKFFQDKHFFYAILERCDGGELFHQIVSRRQFTEEDASFLCRQMASALAYLHAQGVVHRDVKAENFLFKGKGIDSTIKLIDFGMSARLPECGYLTDLCGSPHYISPELISKRYDQGADMWAFGVMIYLMLFGRYPFEGSKASAIAREVQNKQLNWSKAACPFLTEAAIDFLSRLLDRNEKTRLTAAQALAHPWICQPSSDKAQSVIDKDKLEVARRLSIDCDRQGSQTFTRKTFKIDKLPKPA
ncbi:putative ULK kinase [Cyclospora cayetanensis]|uniref:ULK kinase n=1 Tax=Cyclospora cayetanensis TaxID=88456 RepID=A0A1D3CS16_9EIME|nr:putative ULK kinase [Cyclospora cayetanensis]